MSLCKEHLECLFSIARNRTEDTRRKLYQFKILQFLCQEIELEFECTTAANKQKRNRLLQEAKKSNTQVGKETIVENDIEKSSGRRQIPELRLPGSERKLEEPPKVVDSQVREESPKKEITEEIKNQTAPISYAAPVRKLPFGMPKLNIRGLGLSEIVPEAGNNKTQIEIDQLRLLAEEQKKKNEAPKLSSRRLQISNRNIQEETKPELKQEEIQNIDKNYQQPLQNKPTFNIPKLKVEGLGLSEIIQEPLSALPQSQNLQEHYSKNISQPPIKKSPFAIPKLNVTGLGLSEIIPGTGDPALQQNYIPESSQEQLKQKDEEIKMPQQKKSMGFSIPKLNVVGLGLSEIIPGTGDPQPSIHSVQDKPMEDAPANNIPAKKPFSLAIPKLNVAGLGLSEIIPGTGDSQPIPPVNDKQPTQDPTPPPQPKKPLFSIPKLNVAGLGLSEIIPGTSGDPIINPASLIPQVLDIPQSKPLAADNLSTLNPGDGADPIDYHLPAASQQTNDDMLFQQRQSQRGAPFENTAPIKMYEQPNESIDKSMMTFQGSSAPQENRKNKKQNLVMPPTRNKLNDLGMKESIESAQFIHKANWQQKEEDTIEKKRGRNEEPEIRINEMRVSQQLRVESVIDAQSMISASIAPTPQPELLLISTLEAQATSNLIKPPYNILVSQTPNPISFNSFSNEDSKISDCQDKKLNPILKKPIMVPSLKIPQKADQPEGKEKIQQQIAYSQQLSEQVEGGNLTKLQKELNKNNVKFQVLIEKQKSQKQLITPQEVEGILEEKPEDKTKAYEEEAFYLKERSMRPIYQDEELHVLMLSLTVCLLLTPERGTLDELYCSQYPLDNGKQNILFLMHHHLNHSKNNSKSLVHKVLDRVHRQVSPPLAGVRLLKLLCTSLFDIGLYNNGKDWKKIAEGAYAKVFESKTNLAEPQLVAIKQLFLPKSIYDRCVLHDIFTEITCLEELRLEPCISDLYDYGVDSNSYYIVMKRYTCSLRQWRQNQSKGLNENLSLYLSIYKEFLKSLLKIHSHNVTHYDIKCDNVFLDFNTDGNFNSLSNQFFAIGENDEDKIRLTIGDFGECKIFSSEKDEFCQRNRGTDFCKSPEMLLLTINTRKDTDKYDRRKQVGTTRLSDVWSAGCLLYELLTGEFLFYNPDYLQFHFRVVRNSEALFTQERLDKINNNVYLIDFMKYMLVRDPRLRPSIQNVMKRFEHVHALLVSTTGGVSGGLANMRIGYEGGQSNQVVRGGGGNHFEVQLEQATQLMMINSKIPEDLEKKQNSGFLMKIMEDLYLCNIVWINQQLNEASSGQSLIKMNITHLVLTDETFVSNLVSLRDSFTLLELQTKLHYPDGTQLNASSFLLLPQVLDFLRSVSLTRGRVLFLESSSSSPSLIRECILLSMTHMFQTNAYETYTLIHSQNLFFHLDKDALTRISQFTSLTSKISNYLTTFPKFQCKCGSCTIILKRQYANYSNMETTNCNCCQYYRNIEQAQCPSTGCSEYIQFLKMYFKSSNIENLQWGFLEGGSEKASEKEPFVIGPKYLGNIHFKSKQAPNAQSAVSFVERMLASNLSETLDRNSTLAALIDKKPSAVFSRQDPPPRKQQDFNNSTTGLLRWKLYKCKTCHVWTHAETDGNRFAILLNNRVKDSKNKNHQVNIRTLTNAKHGSVRVPILQKLKMNLPF